jgi:PadR family transcriptional regulator, regulatory protein PadR
MENQTRSQLYLGEFEEIVLLAILRLKQDAYGVRIRQEIENETSRSTSIGSIYTTLERLEAKGYVKSQHGEVTPERGGRAKRYFKIQGAGAEALNQAMIDRTRMLDGVDLKWLPAW